MIYEKILFFALAGLLVIAATAVVTVRNPVHAVMSLVLTFFTSSMLWILLRAEFLGITLILVYVGAVMVLFLFVVMMLDIDTTPMREGFVRYLPVGLIVAVVMLVEILTLIGVKSRIVAFGPDPVTTTGAANTKWLAETLYTKFLLPFELAAVILTVAVIAAVMLTLRRRTGIKTQNPSLQSAVRAEDRLRMVKMEAVKPQPIADDIEEAR